MRIAVIAPEAAPWSKTGGLGDVIGALPRHLAAEAEVLVITPLYRSVRKHALEPLPTKVDVDIRTEQRRASFFAAKAGTEKLQWVFVEHDLYFDRDGPYGTSDGDYADNCERFVFFCRAALEFLDATGWTPDVIHCHDWQTGLVPVYLKSLYQDRFPATRSVITIHNMAYQGIFWHLDVPLTGLDWGLFNWRQLEFHGRLNLLKAGLIFADAITTVSPTYAREIRTPEFGCGLDGVLEDRRYQTFGILNGIDTAEWDPAADRLIPARYSAKAMTGKAKCKSHLQKKLGLPPEKATPLVGLVGRLVEQKGVDLLVQAARDLLRLDLQLAILGSGAKAFQEELSRLADIYSDRISVTIGFDELLAHEIEAGADFFLMPSRFEPCGLNQMYSLRYGTVPVVRKTGGLADTVHDGRTGIVFEPATPAGLLEGIRRAMALYGRPRELAAMRKAGMAEDFSWEASAERYLALFQGVVRAT